MRKIARLFVPVAIAAVFAAGCGDNANPGDSTTPATSAPAGNGIADLTGEEILSKAADALKAAGSYRVKGDIVAEGTKLTLDVMTDGEDVMGTVGMEQGVINILRIGSDVYFKADQNFWKQFGGQEAEVLAPLFKDKWVKTDKDNQDFASFTEMTNVGELLKHEGAVTKGEITTINGVSAISLKDSTGEGALYVATTGEPYPLRLEGPEGEGAIDFSDFGATFDELKAPPAEEVVDLSKLGK